MSTKKKEESKAPEPKTEDTLLGIRKTGPNEYRVVRAKIVNGAVAEHELISEPQELRFAAMELRRFLKHHVETIQ